MSPAGPPVDLNALVLMELWKGTRDKGDGDGIGDGVCHNASHRDVARTLSDYRWMGDRFQENPNGSVAEFIAPVKEAEGRGEGEPLNLLKWGAKDTLGAPPMPAPRPLHVQNRGQRLRRSHLPEEREASPHRESTGGTVKESAAPNSSVERVQEEQLAPLRD